MDKVAGSGNDEFIQYTNKDLKNKLKNFIKRNKNNKLASLHIETATRLLKGIDKDIDGFFSWIDVHMVGGLLFIFKNSIVSEDYVNELFIRKYKKAEGKYPKQQPYSGFAPLIKV